MTDSADPHASPEGIYTTEELVRRLQSSRQDSLGGLPSPDVLRQYDEILGPGAAERLVRMAEFEAEHRHYLAARRERLRDITVLISLMLPVLSVLAAILLLIRDNSQSPTVFVTLFATGIAGFGYVASTFRNRDDER